MAKQFVTRPPIKQFVTRFRIYTEDVAPTDERLVEVGVTADVIVSREFGAGYTMIRTVGGWDGGRENALLFEILGADNLETNVFRVAAEIQRACGQDVVIVTADCVQEFTFTGA